MKVKEDSKTRMGTPGENHEDSGILPHHHHHLHPSPAVTYKAADDEGEGNGRLQNQGLQQGQSKKG